MSERQLDLDSQDKRKILWIVLALNVAIAAGFFATGYVGDSSALIANGLDNSSDVIVYAISLLALMRSSATRWTRRGASSACRIPSLAPMVRAMPASPRHVRARQNRRVGCSPRPGRCAGRSFICWSTAHR